MPPPTADVAQTTETRTVAPGVPFESTLERDFVSLCAFDPTVVAINAQPVTILYDAGSGVRRYTPDYLVRYRPAAGGVPRLPLLVEVKYADDLRKHADDYRDRFRAAHIFARQHGWKFRVLTEQQIRGPYLANARFLAPFRDHDEDVAATALIVETLARLGPSDVGGVLRAVYRDPMHQAMLLPFVWRLVARREVESDLLQPLTMTSTLWLPAFSPASAPASPIPPAPGDATAPAPPRERRTKRG